LVRRRLIDTCATYCRCIPLHRGVLRVCVVCKSLSAGRPGVVCSWCRARCARVSITDVCVTACDGTRCVTDAVSQATSEATVLQLRSQLVRWMLRCVCVCGAVSDAACPLTLTLAQPSLRAATLHVANRLRVVCSGTPDVAPTPMRRLTCRPLVQRVTGMCLSLRLGVYV
jgi:hypothetical protein